MAEQVGRQGGIGNCVTVTEWPHHLRMSDDDVSVVTRHEGKLTSHLVPRAHRHVELRPGLTDDDEVEAAPSSLCGAGGQHLVHLTQPGRGGRMGTDGTHLVAPTKDAAPLIRVRHVEPGDV